MTLTTSGLIVTAPHTVALTPIGLPPTPPPGHVRIRVAFCGICHSDLGVLADQATSPGRRLGHEVSGIVIASNASEVEAGTRVAALTYDGYAEVVDVAVHAVVAVPDTVPLDIACLAEPLSCVLSGLDRVPLEMHESALVVGSGFMGLLLIRSLLARGIAVDVIDPRPEAAALAAAAGARPVPCDSNDGYSLVFECSGTAAGLASASDRISIDGTLSIVGYHQSGGGVRFVPLREWNYKAITVVNAHTRDADRIVRYMRKALVAFASGTVDARPWITDIVPFEELPAFLNDYSSADHRASIKAVCRVASSDRTSRAQGGPR